MHGSNKKISGRTERYQGAMNVEMTEMIRSRS